MELNSKLLTGKKALVTGCARGIGKIIAETFLRNGATVFMNSRNNKIIKENISKIDKKYRGKIHPIIFDVSDEIEVKNGFKSIFKVTNSLDILVNNAGIMDLGLINFVNKNLIKKLYETNTFSLYYCSQYASRMMERNKKGSIINITSVVGVSGKAGMSVYSGSKASIIGITKSLSKELSNKNIRVNAIAPGYIKTEMANNSSKSIHDEWISSIPMNRMGSPQEVANAALFLASDLSSYITGEILNVNGGIQ